jgi:maltose-binding protein MalE
VETLKGTVTIWQGWKEAEIASLNDVIAKFQAANPDVKFDVLYVPFDDLKGKFETAASTGGGPGLLIGGADWGPGLYDANLVADITGLADAEFLATINPAALGATQYKGALIGLPETVKGVVLFRNKAIIPEPATTVDDFIAKATAATAGDVMGADFEYGFFFSAPILNAVGGSLMTAAGDPAFNDAKGVEYINTLLKIKAAGIPMENYTDNDVNSFKAGKVGWIIDGTWNATSLADSIGAENLAIDAWPTGLSGYTQTENIYLSANVTGDDQAASWAFMKYFLSAEAQTILGEVGTADAPKAGHIPATLGVEVTDPLLKQAATALGAGAAFPVIPEMGAYWDPMNNALKSALDEGKDPATLLQAAFDAITAKIKEIRGQ